MSEQGFSSGIEYVSYRDRFDILPCVDNLLDFRELLAVKVRPGLEQILQTVDRPTVKYAGYALIDYAPSSTQSLDFANPELASSLKAWLGPPLHKPPLQKQDITPDVMSCFDAHLLPDEYYPFGRDVWSRDRHGVAVLGAIARVDLPEMDEFTRDQDEYWQSPAIVFDTRYAVVVEQALILDDMFLYHPELVGNRTIEVRQIVEHLSKQYGLASTVSTRLDQVLHSDTPAAELA